jgi:hypothetical protein
MEYVKGMQEGPDPRYFKMVAGLKHFDAYSVSGESAGVNAPLMMKYGMRWLRVSPQ